jgi:hypothetical protein
MVVSQTRTYQIGEHECKYNQKQKQKHGTKNKYKYSCKKPDGFLPITYRSRSI